MIVNRADSVRGDHVDASIQFLPGIVASRVRTIAHVLQRGGLSLVARVMEVRRFVVETESEILAGHANAYDQNPAEQIELFISPFHGSSLYEPNRSLLGAATGNPGLCHKQWRSLEHKQLETSAWWSNAEDGEP